MFVHKQHINTSEYKQIALSERLDVCEHKQFHIFPFHKLTGGDNICRREKEKHFIRTLKPKLNNVDKGNGWNFHIYWIQFFMQGL